MDAPDLPPLPPLPLGDPAGPPADADALRGILQRHRHRQLASGALAAAIVLAAGGAAGFAVGHGTAPAAHAVQVAADTPASADGASPAAHVPGIEAYGISGGSSASASSVTVASPAFTQLLVRNASDGTRVRLYEQQYPAPKITCTGGASCPEVMMPPCGPSSFLTAEVSDDDVAGQTGAPVWSATTTQVLDVLDVGVVGAGQPQPVLVVVARAQAAVAKVTLTTPYGSDQETPAAGWTALAVRLPADFTKAGTAGIGASTLMAADSSGKTLVSEPLNAGGRGGPPCVPCPAVGPGARPGHAAGQGPGVVGSGGGSGGGSASAPSRGPAGGLVSPPPQGAAGGLVSPAPGACPFPCPAAGSAVKGALPNMRMCLAPPKETTTTVAAPASPQETTTVLEPSSPTTVEVPASPATP